MNAAQISRARAIAEESDDGQLIRQLCDALEHLQDCE